MENNADENHLPLKRNARLPVDDETLIKLFSEAIKNPKGQVLYVAFNPNTDGTANKSLKLKGGEGIVETLLAHAIVLNNADSVLAFIRATRHLMDVAEKRILDHHRNASINN